MDNTIISYLIKVSVALAIFYGVYILCLRTDTFLKLRRFYFLFAIAFSLAFPVFIIEIPVQEEAPVVQIPTYWLSEMNPVMVVAETEASTEIDVWTIVLTGLSIVSGIYAGRFMLQLSCILRLRIKNDSERFQSYRIVKMKEKGLSAFSFFNWIFINRDTQDVQKLDEIMRHEQVHAEQYHSIDTILSEILCMYMFLVESICMADKERDKDKFGISG